MVRRGLAPPRKHTARNEPGRKKPGSMRPKPPKIWRWWDCLGGFLVFRFEGFRSLLLRLEAPHSSLVTLFPFIGVPRESSTSHALASPNGLTKCIAQGEENLHVKSRDAAQHCQPDHEPPYNDASVVARARDCRSCRRV